MMRRRNETSIHPPTLHEREKGTHVLPHFCCVACCVRQVVVSSHFLSQSSFSLSSLSSLLFSSLSHTKHTQHSLFGFPTLNMGNSDSKKKTPSPSPSPSPSSTPAPPAAGAGVGGVAPWKTKRVVVLQDAENLHLPRRMDGHALFSSVIRAAVGAVEPGVNTDALNPTTDVEVTWYVVIPGVALPEASMRALRLCGALHVDPGPKKGAVDTQIKALAGCLLREQHLLRSVDEGLAATVASSTLVVLLTGDGDFSGDVRSLCHAGFPVVVINRGKNKGASQTLGQLATAHLTNWSELVGSAELAGSPSGSTRSLSDDSESVGAESDDGASVKSGSSPSRRGAPKDACRDWMNQGYCQRFNTKQCRFKHELATRGMIRDLRADCRDWLKGSCPRSDLQCAFRHDKAKAPRRSSRRSPPPSPPRVSVVQRNIRAVLKEAGSEGLLGAAIPPAYEMRFGVALKPLLGVRKLKSVLMDMKGVQFRAVAGGDTVYRLASASSASSSSRVSAGAGSGAGSGIPDKPSVDVMSIRDNLRAIVMDAGDDGIVGASIPQQYQSRHGDRLKDLIAPLKLKDVLEMVPGLAWEAQGLDRRYRLEDESCTSVPESCGA
mgnify:CR=1 FL=1